MSSSNRSGIRAGLCAALLFLAALHEGPFEAQSPDRAAQEPAKPAASQQGAEAQPPDPQTPVFRTGINFVRVDVIATDKAGNPVSDLKQADFQITEDGKPQTIETFKFVTLDGGVIPAPEGPPRAISRESDEELEAARDDVRLFGMFLDDYHVRRESSPRSREELARFVETQLGPSDMIGIMYPLEPAAGVRFTRNHSGVASGLRQFVGRKGDYTPRNQFEDKYAHYPTETVERIRNEVSLSALQALIIRMGALKEGRKALILVSEGYTNMVPPELRSRVAGIPGLGNPAAGDPTVGSESLLEERAAFIADSDMQIQLRRVYAMANRNNVAIYSVDPRGLSSGEFGIDQNVGPRSDRTYLNSTMDTLRTLASETDGRAIVNRNDLTLVMRQIVRDSSSYYLIGYSSTTSFPDGKFHDIRVRVSRPGVQVRARNGYWALAPEEAERALTPPKPGPPQAVVSALAAISEPARRRLIRTWLGTDRGENGRVRMTFLWEPVPRVPGEAAANAPATVRLTALAPDGSPYFRGQVPSPSSRVTFEVQPGAMRLQLSVEGADAGVLDTETRDITVPDLTSSQTLLGTPAVYRARTVRELQQLKTDVRAIPTATREFVRTERVHIRVAAYGPGGAVPALTARLLNRAGEPMTNLAVIVDPGMLPAIDVPLTGLPVGEYVVEIKAAGTDGGASQHVGFRVTS
jgi:VWFA-related protein